MGCPSLLLVSGFNLPLAADFPYLLQVRGGGSDDFASLREIDADEEVDPRILCAKVLEEGGEFRIADFIEVQQLLLIQAYLRRPVLDQRIGLGIRIEIVPEYLDH
jgi:hypothetical protein